MATGSQTIGNASAGQVVSTTFLSVSGGVQLKADDSNTGSIYIGYSSSVTAGTNGPTDGVRIAPGQSYFVPYSRILNSSNRPDASMIWARADSAGQKIYFDVG